MTKGKTSNFSNASSKVNFIFFRFNYVQGHIIDTITFFDRDHPLSNPLTTA